MTIAEQFLRNTGPTSRDTPTSEQLNPSSEWMCFAGDFRASQYPLPVNNSDKQMTDGFGLSSADSFAFYDQDTHSLKTYQGCLMGGWATFSGTWPKCGLMRNGTLFPLKTSEHPTFANGSGFLPTPTREATIGGYSSNHREKWNQFLRLPTLRANDAEKRGNINHDDKRNGYPAAFFRLPTLGANEFKGSAKDRYRDSENFHGAKMSEGLRTSSADPIYLNPCFGEVVMGYPIGWTELTPSETPSSHKSPHGSASES